MSLLPSPSSCCNPCDNAESVEIVSAIGMLAGEGSPEGVVTGTLAGQIYTDLTYGLLYQFAGVVNANTGWFSTGVINARVTARGTSDDTSAIQALLDVAAYQTVFFPGPFTYNVRNLVIPSNVTIDGSNAVLKLKQLVTLDSSPLITVAGTNVKILNVTLDGNKAVQPADGFSDSFNTGGNGRGRAFRGLIVGDGSIQSVNGLTVKNCTFKNAYGGCVVVRDTNDLTVSGCVGETNYFEHVFLDRTDTNFNDNIAIYDNRGSNYNSGDAITNSNFATIVRASHVRFANNFADTCARTMCKLNGCKESVVVGNTFRNSTAFYPMFQLDAQTAGMVNNNITVVGNSGNHIGQGILIEGQEARNITVTGNVFKDVSLGTVPDGISIGSTTVTSDIIIANNVIEATRMGVLVSYGNRIQIIGNTLTGTASTNLSVGILVNANMDMSDIAIAHNTIRNFNQDTTHIGVLSFIRAAAQTITNLYCANNTIDAGANANLGLRVADTNWITGRMDNNKVTGRIDLNQSGLESVFNVATGAVTLNGYDALNTIRVVSTPGTSATALEGLRLVNSGGSVGAGTSCVFALGSTEVSRIESVLDAASQVSMRFYTYNVGLAEAARFNNTGDLIIVNSATFDHDATAGATRLRLWDITAGTLKRVTLGIADSGGVGFKLLRVAN